MNNNKIKKIIIILLIILLICTFFIVFILKKENVKNSENLNEIVPVKTKKVPVEKVKTYEEYVIVKNIINRYLVYNSLENAEALYNMLDKDYIKSKNITKYNLMDKIKNINKTEFIINEINYQELNEFSTKYIVKCSIYSNTENDNNQEIKQRDYEEMVFQVILDKFNTTFSIIPKE